MSGEVDQRFAAPQAFVEDVATATGAVLAGRWTRLLALLVDGLILGALTWILMRLPAIEKLLVTRDSGFFDVEWGNVLIGLPMFLAINGWCLIQRGQTLGKMACGLRIVRTNGSKVDPFRIIGLRYGIGYLTTIISGLGYLYGIVDALLIFRESRQCLHDTIADTKVIKL